MEVKEGVNCGCICKFSGQKGSAEVSPPTPALLVHSPLDWHRPLIPLPHGFYLYCSGSCGYNLSWTAQGDGESNAGLDGQMDCDSRRLYDDLAHATIGIGDLTWRHMET